MATHLSIHKPKSLCLFLNISFLFLIITLTTHLHSSNSGSLKHSNSSNSTKLDHYQLNQQDSDDNIGCRQLDKHPDNQAKCSYVKSHKGCQPRGYMPYLQLFYCNNTSPFLGLTALILWLVILFYLLGDTAAHYFCSSLEGLSRVLRLPPTIAGVTLLSLGNGAPDLFSSVASFMGDGADEVGLNSILGGAFFVSSTVVGIINILTSIGDSPLSISMDMSSFLRDVLFLLLSLLFLLVIIIIGKINLWVSISFLSLYFVYVFMVSTSMLCNKDSGGSDLAEAPLLHSVVDDHESLLPSKEDDDLEDFSLKTSNIVCGYFGKLGSVLELPLYLPRRLTIPVISEGRWSKPLAVISVTTAPIFLGVIWFSQSPNMVIITFPIGGSVAAILGILAFFTTVRSNPPTKCLFPWLAGGFLMSITWTYILAQELVSLLVSLGLLIGISPSILGLTVLAWGNSLGDLVANVTMAGEGGPGGVQVAISGSYAGCVFNILFSLGLGFVSACWGFYPSPYHLPMDPSVYETLGFLMGALAWALVVLLKNGIRLNRFLGVGLLVIYLCFLCLKITRALGGFQHLLSLSQIIG